ncbi:DUF2865 domain-containing protein [Tianweitania populi]|uniref:DUF2865 domain-containing protein n=1 Tax=Tianweitania populi TaxID=1607949 RepID=A0A8J3DNK0_9HYPH|nr:DUF2865 domain-containing protein [Tianweitania populi]GHD10110.1 hypothetical protein GCM10016234_11600 [Tianweitania populi]
MAWRQWRSLTGALAGLLLTASLAPSQAVAASPQLCRQLEAELAATGKGSQSSAKAREYDRAITEQERQLSLTEGEWQRADCGYGFDGGADRVCRRIEDTLARMERNYAELQRERARLGSSRSSPVERQRIQRAIDDAGCHEPAPKPQEVAVPRPSQPKPSQDRLRTICVRTSDGYFFPMSYGVTRDDFARDAKACQATCPSTEMRLYYHKVPDQDAAEMVSADKNEPYSALPTANLYRNHPQSGASACAPAAPEPTIASVPEQPAVSAPAQNRPATPPSSAPFEPPVTASPSIQVLPDQSAEPKQAPSVTAAQPKSEAPKVLASPAQENAEKAPAIPTIRPPEPAPARSMSDADKRVRVVGPTFLPAQEGAINLRAPGRTGAQ